MLKNEKNPTHCARGKDSQNGIIAEEKPEAQPGRLAAAKMQTPG